MVSSHMTGTIVCPHSFPFLNPPISEQSFLYIHRCQWVTLFPIRQLGKLLALQTLGLFTQHTGRRPTRART
jgi:hypothetical protein